jgi:hypothetical protein
VSARVSRVSPFLHVRTLTSDGAGTITVACSEQQCEWSATFESGPGGAAEAFTLFNGHLAATKRSAA